MGSSRFQGYAGLARTLIVYLLMVPSLAVAESEYLKQLDPDNYLGYNMKELWVQADGEPAAGSETESVQPDPNDPTGGMSIKELSQQSANPVSKNAYIFTQFATTFNDGDLNTNDAHVAGSITFQPIIPIPLYGEEETEWRIVTRPTVNLFLGQPTYDGNGEPDRFDRETGIGDLLVPLPLALPDKLSGNWLLALGPSFSFPTATDDSFGVDAWCAGVSGVFGYIAENWMLGFYPQTYFKIASQDDDEDDRGARFGNMFYWFFYNITDDWQIGTNPTIQWNDKAHSGNKWNVPVGLTISKVTKWGNTPMRLEFGAEYSVVNEDDWGEVARIKFNIIPVVSRPIKSSIFGSGK